MNERKLLRFLKEEVEGREPLKRGRKRKGEELEREDETENQNGTKDDEPRDILLGQMKQYVSSATHLWKWQKTHDSNLHDSPNGNEVKGYMATMRKKKHEIKDKRLDDRGKSMFSMQLIIQQQWRTQSAHQNFTKSWITFWITNQRENGPIWTRHDKDSTLLLFTTLLLGAN